MLAIHVTHRPGGKLLLLYPLELEQPHFLDIVFLPAVHEPHRLPRLHGSLLDAAIQDHAAVNVVLRVENERLEGGLGIATGSR